LAINLLHNLPTEAGRAHHESASVAQHHTTCLGGTRATLRALDFDSDAALYFISRCEVRYHALLLLLFHISISIQAECSQGRSFPLTLRLIFSGSGKVLSMWGKQWSGWRRISIN